MFYYTVKTNQLQMSLINKYASDDLHLRKAVNKRRYNNINKTVYDGFHSGLNKDELRDVKQFVGRLSYIDFKGIGIKHSLFLFVIKLLPYNLLTIIFRWV